MEAAWRGGVWEGGCTSVSAAAPQVPRIDKTGPLAANPRSNIEFSLSFNYAIPAAS